MQKAFYKLLTPSCQRLCVRVGRSKACSLCCGGGGGGDGDGDGDGNGSVDDDGETTVGAALTTTTVGRGSSCRRATLGKVGQVLKKKF